MKAPPIIEIGGVLVAADILTECFCCDLEKCKGVCCVFGDAGAPVSLDDIAQLEGALGTVWNDLSASAQAVIDRQGVAYTDRDGDLVTSIVGGKDCVFTCYDDRDCCLCAVEKAFREGRTTTQKPISCALYPVRERRLRNGMTAIEYNRWDVCRDAVSRGRDLKLPLYRFLEAPLRRRFGNEWYEELTLVAEELAKNGILK